ncbi:MAG: ATP-grasp domain-containing protein [Methylococcales bacterium]
MSFILIVANSGRMLAQAAAQAGLQALVIDMFADVDTRQNAVTVRKITSLAIDHLKPALDQIMLCYGVTEVIYGSGLEYYPDSLAYLAGRLTVLGNSPAVFGALQNKPAFFSALTELAIPHPETVFKTPKQAEGWLLKPWQGLGGIGIRRYRSGQDVDESVYWQKEQPGTACSALFLADGQNMQIVGFNKQWTVGLLGTTEFVFAGIMNSCALDERSKIRLTDWLHKLVPRFGLTGLNSLDFMQAGHSSYVLEINARPPAGLQLYAADLLGSHIKACQGNMPAEIAAQVGVAGYQIIYAQRQISIPEGFVWPDWCMDLSEPGVLIHTGQPICSIIAREMQSQQVLALLTIREHELIKQFERC